jgi:hypothetical protein
MSRGGAMLLYSTTSVSLLFSCLESLRCDSVCLSHGNSLRSSNNDTSRRHYHAVILTFYPPPFTAGVVSLVNEVFLSQVNELYSPRAITVDRQHGAAVPLRGNFYAVTHANQTALAAGVSSLPVGVQVCPSPSSIVALRLFLLTFAGSNCERGSTRRHSLPACLLF